jgi:hypothetical protein
VRCLIADKEVRVDVPRRLIGHMTTAVAVPVAVGRKEPTLDQLRAR